MPTHTQTARTTRTPNLAADLMEYATLFSGPSSLGSKPEKVGVKN